MKKFSGKKGHPLQQLHPLESLGLTPATSGEIRVERIEHRLTPKVPFPHRHDFYHLLFLEKGSGWHEIDFQRFKVKPRQAFLMRPGQVHAWALGAGTRGYVLEFTRASLPQSRENRDIWKLLEAAPTMAVSLRAEDLAATLKLMLGEFDERGPGYRLALEHLLYTFLLKFAREKASMPMPRPEEATTERFLLLVEENFARHHKVDEYAHLLGITPKSLTIKVKRALGRSAGAVIQERCLVEAKRLLAYSELSVAQVGYELGYDDPNYFARYFRKHTGMAPGRFRRLASRTVHA